MRLQFWPIAVTIAAAYLTGCKSTDGTPMTFDGTMIGTAKELANPGSTYKERQSSDDAKCRNYGFNPGTEAYGNCRLKIDQTRAIAEAAPSSKPQETGSTTSTYFDTKTARSVTCTGPEVSKTCF